MNEQYKTYLLSAEWASLRVDIITARKCCERCGRKKNLQVHHKTYRNIFNEEPSDLEVLCDKCHRGEHFTPKGKRKQKGNVGQSLANKVAAKKAKRRRKLKKLGKI